MKHEYNFIGSSLLKSIVGLYERLIIKHSFKDKEVYCCNRARDGKIVGVGGDERDCFHKGLLFQWWKIPSLFKVYIKHIVNKARYTNMNRVISFLVGSLFLRNINEMPIGTIAKNNR
jgi:hypothetical protein